MPAARRGLSLVECVVAIVLCAVGLLGVTAALLTAQRLERSAEAMRRMAHQASQRISWFEAIPCPPRDTTWRQGDAGVAATWTVARSDSGVTLVGSLTAPIPGPTAPLHLPIQLHRPCG
ncbi:MAG: type IV pilus modification PilV family protein [Gemmatimonadaceae bacterium]|jgi:Tfp pilus assembly protein PilV